MRFDDMLIIHREAMGRGGHFPAPLRDERSLAMLLLRVRTEDELATSDNVRQAAILAVGLVQQRPFEWGNVETAIAALAAILGVNHISLETGSFAALGPFLRVIAEEHDLEDAIDRFETRLRARLRP